MQPTPSENANLELRRGDFDTIVEALDYAAQGATGFNFYAGRGELADVLSYAELQARARDVADRLITAGLPAGARLLLLADTDRDFMIMFMACQYASILPVPVALPTSFGERDSFNATLRRQLEDSGAAAAMAPSDLVGNLQTAGAGLDIGIIGAPDDFYALPSGSGDLRPFGGDDLCYIQYSSGSTREPRGIEISQKALMANCSGTAQAGLEVVPGDRCVSWLPLYHDMGLVGFMLTPLVTQLSVDYLTTRDFARRPLLWLKLISDNRGTIAYSPSFGYDICVRRVRSDNDLGLDLSCWRVAGIGGDMIQPRILEAFAERFGSYGFREEAFVPSYGMAETVLAVTFAPLETGFQLDPVERDGIKDEDVARPAAPVKSSDGGDAVREFVFCGAPLPGYRIEIRDEAGRTLPDRRLGRVNVQGPSVMRGYYNRPEETARIIDADGWLDTGDIGYMVDGTLVISGRGKDLIILNGRNIWPQDLEWAVEEIPGLRRGDAAAFSIEEGSGEQVVMLVQCRLSDPEEREKLRREVIKVLRAAAIPEPEVVLVPPRSLPQTTSGKLSRSRAKAKYLEGGFCASVGADGGQEGASPGSLPKVIAGD